VGSLDGRVAIITGATGSIGREHALFFAAEGARVVLNESGGPANAAGGGSSMPARQVIEEIRARGGDAVADTHDVTDWDGARGVVQRALDTYGDLHILVNNAGAGRRDRVLVDLSKDEWELALRVTLGGQVAPTRWAAVYWADQAKGGRQVRASVVNTSSESGVFGNAGQSAHVAATAALVSLTLAWAKELGRYGVRVNAVLPRARNGVANGDLPPAPEEGFDALHPGNVSPFVAYLASEACPLTAETFCVTGGTIQRVRPWEPDPSWILTADDRWTVGRLDKAVADAEMLATNACPRPPA
jgi:NAD(P)-dependent dehydrogenase (short-subunit alcohol dehydrogenase family)